MSERTNVIARDRTALLDRAEAPQRVKVSPLDASTRFSLRIAPTLATSIREAGGFDLTGAINSAIATGALISVRLGPDEWLLIGPDGQGKALTHGIETALAGHFHSLVDVSHRNIAISVAGREAVAVLNAGVAIDLDDAAFPAGSATRTVFGKAEIVLIRTGADRTYRVECWRSFAPYVRQYLEDAAREFAAR